MPSMAATSYDCLSYALMLDSHARDIEFVPTIVKQELSLWF